MVRTREGPASSFGIRNKLGSRDNAGWKIFSRADVPQSFVPERECGQIKGRRVGPADRHGIARIGVITSTHYPRDPILVGYGDQAKMVGPEGLEPSTKGL
jgi:hypothetical protein